VTNFGFQATTDDLNLFRVWLIFIEFEMGSLKNILLVGSTGRIGSAIRHALVSHRDHFEKIGVLTTSASISDPKKKAGFDAVEKEGLVIVLADLEDKESLVKALKGMSSHLRMLTDRMGCSYLRVGASCSS